MNVQQPYTASANPQIEKFNIYIESAKQRKEIKNPFVYYKYI